MRNDRAALGRKCNGPCDFGPFGIDGTTQPFGGVDRVAKNDHGSHVGESSVVRLGLAFRDAHGGPYLITAISLGNAAGDPVGDARKDRPSPLAQILQVAGHVGMEGEGPRDVEGYVILMPGCGARQGRRLPVRMTARSPRGIEAPCGHADGHCWRRQQCCGFGNRECSRRRAAAAG